ncbi:MAG TPA: YtxH domain-containing protein [Microbacteriaceae bacterium]|jgi:hypothetical protein|nr:YtxH domain-containing protein [Microbacteriaceae bacterium]
MKGKLLFVAGAAVGYVLGARAGRKRYEQIRGAAERIWETPGVQNQVEQVKDFAAQRVGDIPSAIADGAQKAFTSLVNSRKNTSKQASASQAASESSAANVTAPAAPPSEKAATKTAATKASATKAASTKSGGTAAKKPASTRAKSKPSADSE